MLLEQYKILFLFSTISIWLACNSQVKVKTKENISSNVSKVTTDIPAGMRDSSFLKIKSNIEYQLGISPLENGFKGLLIRVWKGFPHTDYMQLKTFTKIDGKWSAQLYNLVLHYNKNFDSVISITKEVVQKEPCSGRSFFSDSLMKLNILDLPDESKVPNYYNYVNMDAKRVMVEIATIDKYRIYTYSDVESVSERIDEAKKMSQILKLIEKEFSSVFTFVPYLTHSVLLKLYRRW